MATNQQGDPMIPETPNEHMIKEFELMHHDFYVGGGKDSPSYLFRLALVEEAIARFSRNSSKLVWIGVGILGALLTNLMMGHIKLQ
jgi:hypothetical protein